MVAVATIKNNASSTLLTAISAVDTGLVVAYGDGTLFPTITASDYYFYMTLVNTDDTYEIVKVTARSGDSMTVTRAQEGTSAIAFTAGARVELRVTAQSILDLITANAASLAAANSWTGIQTFASATTEIAKSGAAAKLRFWDTTLANYHGIRNVAGALTLDYNGTSWATVSTGGVVAFVSGPTVAGSAIYYAGGTDVPVTDGGTGASTASGARTNLGLAIGSDVQAYSLLLTNLAAASTAADKLLYNTSGTAWAATDLTSFARTLLDDTTAAAARTTLGLGTMATQAASAVAITGGTLTGITSGQMTMKASVHTSGPLDASDADSFCAMTGNVSIAGGLLSDRQAIVFYSGASSKTISEGASMTLRLGGSSSTGTRTLAAYTLAVGVAQDNGNTFVISGSGVT